MGRVLTLGLVGFLVAAAFLLPAPREVQPGTLPEQSGPRFAVCLVEQGGGRSTEISASSVSSGRVQLTLFTAGRSSGSIGSDLEGPGSALFPIVDVAAVGTVGALLELPDENGAASSLIRGAESLAADSCVSDTPADVYLTGGRTTLPDRFELHLINPFASDAVVRLLVTSEVGIESNPTFNSVVVRARSSAALNMSQLTPGRQRLSVLVESQDGRVVAIGRQTAPSESAMWSAVAPATDWYLPLAQPEGRRVVIGNPYATEAEFQLDAYSLGGLSPAVLSGVVPAGGEVSVDLSELDDLGLVALRLITTTPVVVSEWQEGGSALTATTAISTTALRWLVPAALHQGLVPDDPDLGILGESGTMLIFNPGLEDAEVSVTVLGLDGSSTDSFVVQGEAVIGIPMVSGDARLVESTAPVVVTWFGGAGGRGASAPGVPLKDG
jgi:hypothetical protein